MSNTYNNDYLDSLVKELEDNGIKVPMNESDIRELKKDDKELQIILDMERETGKEYSQEQRKILEHHGNACILACAGSGKALTNDMKVLTIEGYKEIGKIREGEIVYNEKGEEQRVIGVYPQGKKKVYKVKLSGDREIKCCKDHLWGVIDKSNIVIKSTLEIQNILRHREVVNIPKAKFNIDKLGDKVFNYNVGVEGSIVKLCRELTYLVNELEVESKELLGVIKLYLEMTGNICTVDNNIIKYYNVSMDSIIGIEETDDYEEMTCIKVDGPSELFLTDNCVVTHNTTISTHLIAKRIQTGEIKDVNKLIYTTYSKAGATEMSDRLKVLLEQLGRKEEVQVRTLHSFFLQIIRTLGVKHDTIRDKDKFTYLKQACKDANYIPKDDELLLIDNLLSYQVNNLLSDKKTIESYVNTLEDLTLEQYSAIRKGYANQKNINGVIDFDDMQSYLYLWLVKYAKSNDPKEVALAEDIRNYCKSMYTDFYIDEAQDVSKIQFAIIRAMVCDPNDNTKLDRNLVFIGDDDQCLVSGTLIELEGGTYKKIEDIKVGDKVLSYNNGRKEYNKVINVTEHKTPKTDSIVKIKTASNKIIECTSNHKLMVKIDYNNYYKVSCNNREWVVDDTLYEMLAHRELKYSMLNVLGLGYEYPHFGESVREENGFKVILASSVLKGMTVCIKDDTGNFKEEIIKEVEFCKVSDANKVVYDINIENNNNFFANGVLVHNCIYQWRGGDPSIILSVGPLLNMPTFVLSTNYRCLNEIVDYATTGIKCNSSRFDKGMNAFNKGGKVSISISDKEDLCSLSISAMKQIKYWIKQGDSVKDIAVLSRNNFHLALLSNMLLREGIYCQSTDDMKLTKSTMYKEVKELVSLHEDSWKPDLTARLLWRLCRYMGVSNAKVIADFQDNCALSLSGVLGWITKKFIKKDIEYKLKPKITLQVEQRMEYIINKLSTDTINDIYNLYIALTTEDKVERVRIILYQYLNASSFMYKSKDKHRSILGLVQYILNLIRKDGIDNMLSFLRMVEQLEEGKMVITDDKVTLSTIHSAKGREWKNVIMFACDNISQPSFDGIAGMLEDNISIHDIFENLNEERRLFYVGNTRARENLFVLTYKQPSVFILEALGLFSNQQGGNNAKILEFIENSNVDWCEQYKDFIDTHIRSKDSKYYYNKEEIEASIE